MANRAVFLDRDDTLIENAGLPDEAFAGGVRGDLADPGEVRLLPGVRRACVSFRRAGLLLVIVTNQGVVARGGATIEEVEATNRRVCDLLEDPDAPGTTLITRVYYCPFHPLGTVAEYTREHPWRKPAPGMLLAAAESLEIDLDRSWMVGDAARDIEAGIAAGIAPERALRVGPEGEFGGLGAAAARILAGS